MEKERINMLRSEFETLTRIYPSEMLYSVIEEFYNDSKLDKHEFCENYKLNADGLAERIQREANMLEDDSENCIYALGNDLDREKERAVSLEKALIKLVEVLGKMQAERG